MRLRVEWVDFGSCDDEKRKVVAWKSRLKEKERLWGVASALASKLNINFALRFANRLLLTYDPPPQILLRTVAL
jgi:hypothetical protein